MSTTAPKPATTPMPVQLSAPAFEALLWPHLSMPKREPKGTLGYDRVFNLSVWVLYPGMQWKCVPVPHDAQGPPAMHATTVYTVFAPWAAAGSLWPAFGARVRHLATAKHLDTSVRHGDGTHTVAHKGAMAAALPATSTKRATKASPASPSLATSSRRSLWLPSMRQRGACYRRVCQPCQRWPKRWGWPCEAPRLPAIVALIPPTIARGFSMRAGSPTSKTPHAIATPPSVDGSGSSTPLAMRCGCGSNGPARGKRRSSGCGSALKASTSGTMECSCWHTRWGICANSAVPKTCNQLY